MCLLISDVVCRVMRECTEEWGEGGEMTSSDEDTPTGEPANEQGPPLISDEDYRRMLQRHKRTQLRKKVLLCILSASCELSVCVV